MYQIDITASRREVSGKGPMRRLRLQGKTPGVVYGGGREAQMLELDSKDLYAKLLEFYRKNTVVRLTVDGVEKSVHFGEVQTHPVTDKLLHVDFCEIDLDRERQYSVPINFEGVAKGVDLGGDMIINHNELQLSGKPLDIPDSLSVDVSALSIGDSISCGDIALPASVTLVTDSDDIVVSVDKAG